MDLVGLGCDCSKAPDIEVWILSSASDVHCCGMDFNTIYLWLNFRQRAELFSEKCLTNQLYVSKHKFKYRRI